jgi:hypothetical protein
MLQQYIMFSTTIPLYCYFTTVFFATRPLIKYGASARPLAKSSAKYDALARSLAKFLARSVSDGSLFFIFSWTFLS